MYARAYTPGHDVTRELTMSVDPVAKFFTLSGAAAAALSELERVGRKRCSIQGELADLQRRTREWRVGSEVTARIAELEVEVRYLMTRESALLDEHQRAEGFEARLRGTLQSRGLM